MGSLRRASFHLKNRGLDLGTLRICCGNSEVQGYYLENNKAESIEHQGESFDGLLSSAKFYNSYSGFSKPCFAIRRFSSKAYGKICGEGDGFSNVKATRNAVEDATSGDENDDGMITEPEQSVEDIDEKRSSQSKDISQLTKELLAVSTASVGEILDKWVKEGNEVTETEALSTMISFRNRRMYVRALQISKWWESIHIGLSKSFYASRVDLIAKVHGLLKAEDYLKQIPESFRCEEVYRNFLANCASKCNKQKTEEVFKKMKSLGFTISCFSYNQLLSLYKKIDRTKIAHVLSLMAKENIKPSLFTYQILIDVKGQQNDIIGMEKIVETMNAEGVELPSQIKTALARHYAHAGLKDKAVAILKELQGNSIEKNRWACKLLLPLYASFGIEEEVERVWKVCELNPYFSESIAAIDAWGKLHRIEKAEAIFGKLLEKTKTKTLSSKHFTALLTVYADNKMLEKGVDLVKIMEESGVNIGPRVCDALVKLFISAGEVEKAESILQKLYRGIKVKPQYSSFMNVLHQYENRGDIHNSEKIFLKMQQAGYVSGIQPFRALLRAYLNAKSPVYGFIERMKFNNVFPTKEVVNMLAQANAFRNTSGV